VGLNIYAYEFRNDEYNCPAPSFAKIIVKNQFCFEDFLEIFKMVELMGNVGWVFPPEFERGQLLFRNEVERLAAQKLGVNTRDKIITPFNLAPEISQIDIDKKVEALKNKFAFKDMPKKKDDEDDDDIRFIKREKKKNKRNSYLKVDDKNFKVYCDKRSIINPRNFVIKSDLVLYKLRSIEKEKIGSKEYINKDGHLVFNLDDDDDNDNFYKLKLISGKKLKYELKKKGIIKVKISEQFKKENVNDNHSNNNNNTPVRKVESEKDRLIRFRNVEKEFLVKI
jgi:hypothetical protein